MSSAVCLSAWLVCGLTLAGCPNGQVDPPSGGTSSETHTPSDDSDARVEFDFVVNNPRHGGLIALSTVDVSGRILHGSPTTVLVDGVAASMRDDTFVRSDVTVSPGVTIIPVSGRSATFELTRRVVVLQEPVQMLRVVLTWNGKTASLEPPQPVPTTAMTDGSGVLGYRIVDSQGTELFRASVPDTASDPHDDSPDSDREFSILFPETAEGRVLEVFVAGEETVVARQVL